MLLPTVKPDPTQCPGRFCFLWGGPASSDLPDAAQVQAHCDNPFGVCTRLAPETGDLDWYESDNDALRKAGLPWFYFIPSTRGLVAELHDAYREASEALWGKGHDAAR